MDQQTTDRPAAPAQTAPEARQGWLGTFQKDFLASIVVFLVALPLCMGIANACGLPPALGIITGIVGGIIVGFLAGCPLQVSGPAAGLVVTVAQIVQDERLGVAMLGVVVLGGGVLQLAAGFLRLGQWFRAVSPAVIEGMLAGIGVLIFAGQFHVMVDDKPHKGEYSGVKNLISIPEAVQKGLMPPPAEHKKDETPKQYDEAEQKVANHRHAAQIGVLTILVIVIWKGLMPKKLQLLPAQLLAILLATVTCVVLGFDVLRVPMPEGGLFSAVSFPTWENLSRVVEKPVLVMMFTIAFVASAETLLCATAVDQMHSGPRTKYDRELAGQGVGNIICGLLGALPMTGVIVRSSANVEAGAKTRASTIMHGLWLLLIVVFATALLEQIPTAALAAVLVYTGYKLMNIKVVKELWAWGWSEVAIYLCTVLGVVALGLLEGVLIGVVLAVLKLVWRFSHLSIRLEEDPEGGRAVLHLEGAATFLRLPQLAAALEKVPPASELHVQFSQLSYIDHACLELLMTWEKQHEALGGNLVIDWEELHGRFHTGPNGNGKKGPHAGTENGAVTNGTAEHTEAITPSRK